MGWLSLKQRVVGVERHLQLDVAGDLAIERDLDHAARLDLLPRRRQHGLPGAHRGPADPQATANAKSGNDIR